MVPEHPKVHDVHQQKRVSSEVPPTCNPICASSGSNVKRPKVPQFDGPRAAHMEIKTRLRLTMSWFRGLMNIVSHVAPKQLIRDRLPREFERFLSTLLAFGTFDPASHGSREWWCLCDSRVRVPTRCRKKESERAGTGGQMTCLAYLGEAIESAPGDQLGCKPARHRDWRRVDAMCTSRFPIFVLLPMTRYDGMNKVHRPRLGCFVGQDPGGALFTPSF